MDSKTKKLTLPLLALTTGLLLGCQGEEPKDKEAEVFAIPVEVSEINRSTIASSYNTTAILESRQEAKVVTRVTGIIEKLYVDEGDYVTKGQLLAEIDPQRYQLALATAESDLASVRQERKRLAHLQTKALISRDKLDKLRFKEEAALAQRDLAALDLKESQVVAPLSGYIAQRYVRQGHFTQGFEKLLHIVDQAELQGIVYLPERQLGKTAIGQQAKLQLSAYPDHEVSAIVSRIAPVIDANSGTFKVILKVDNHAGQFKPGMFAQVALTFDTHQNVLTVPQKAVISLDNQNKLFVIRDNKAVGVDVKVGYQQGNRMEISGDIKEGELIVTTGQHNLKDQATVEVLNAPDQSLAQTALLSEPAVASATTKSK